MGRTLDLGRRLELCSVDPHCQDISLGLYQPSASDYETPSGDVRFLVHTYSAAPGTAERTDFITSALAELAGLERAGESHTQLRFPCRKQHERALKRAFLDICKFSSGEVVEPYPSMRMDKKAECQIKIVPLENGEYQIDAETDSPASQRRRKAVARGFVKLCEMEAVPGNDYRVRFPCGIRHDRLLSLLLFRAQHVRSTLREDEQAGARGVLTAPSQQT